MHNSNTPRSDHSCVVQNKPAACAAVGQGHCVPHSAVLLPAVLLKGRGALCCTCTAALMLLISRHHTDRRAAVRHCGSTHLHKTVKEANVVPQLGRAVQDPARNGVPVCDDCTT